MEFKSLKNIETSFRQIRLFGIIYTAACALVVVCSVVCAFRFAEAQRQKIYVLSLIHILPALSDRRTAAVVPSLSF